jgi:hypothetical protein
MTSVQHVRELRYCPPEAGAQVRILPGAPSLTCVDAGREHPLSPVVRHSFVEPTIPVVWDLRDSA